MNLNTKSFWAILLAVLFTSVSVYSQSLQSSQTIITNNLSKTYSFPKSPVFGKTASCPVDTILYPYYKATALTAVNMNTATSGSIFAQWYDAPQQVTVSGFDFYGWMSNNGTPAAIVSITCKIYNANPSDSLPLGTALAQTVVNVDSTFGLGLLTNLVKHAVFPAPVTVSGPYVITVETSSSTPVSIVTNNWLASPPNGRSEWLSSVKVGNSFLRGYNVNVAPSGFIPFNADFLLQPYVQYNLTADFIPSTQCNQGGNQIIFTNTSSAVLFNRFYNTRAYYNIAYASCGWDYGDTSGTWFAVNGIKVYNNRIPYTVKLRDTLYGWSTGCADIKTALLNAAPSASLAASNSPVCIGSSIKLFADTVLNATGYYWTGPNGFSSNLQQPVIANAGIVNQGNYSLRAIMGQCTSMVTTVAISIQSTPQAASNSPLCAGQTLSLSTSAIPNATYSWTGPNGFSSTLLSPSKPATTQADTGNYSVMITSAGCGNIGPFTTHVTIYPVPATPVASNNGPLCVGDNLNLTATGTGGNYSWSGPNGFSSITQNLSRPIVQASYAGIYSVSVTQSGCTSAAGTTTVVINNNPSTPIASNNGPFCVGQTLSLSASLISSATYTWSGPNGFSSTTQNPVRSNVQLADAGIYSVIAVSNGCSSAAANTVVAVSSSTPTPVAGSNGPLCLGQTLQLTASGVPGATYSWTGPDSFSSAQQNPFILNIATLNGGTYSVTAVTSGCGTSSAGLVNVVINALPQAPSVSSNSPLCDGDTLKLSASNVSGATYNWSGPNGFTSSLQNPELPGINALKAGVYTVYVDVTGCGSSALSQTGIVVRRVPAAPLVTTNSPVCEGDTLKISATSSGTGMNKIFAWSGPNNFSSGQQNIQIGGASSGNTGIYGVTVSDSGCNSTAALMNTSVKSRPATPVATNNGPVCQGNDIQLTSSGIAGASYKWTGPSGYLSLAQFPLLQGSSGFAAGTYFVTASVNGCNSLPAQTNVTIYQLPAIPVASNDGPQCAGNPITLIANAASGVIYSWTGPNGFSSNEQTPVILNTKIGMSGIYTLILIDSHCVSNPDTTLVIINPLPGAPGVSSFPAGSSFCAGDSIQLFATFVSNASYEWSGPGGFGSFLQNPVIRNIGPVNSGTYQVFMTKNGCQSTASNLSFVVHPLPNTGSIFGPDSVLVGTISEYLITGDSGSVFTWVAYGGAIQGANTGTNIQVKWNSLGTDFVRARETAVTGCKGPLMQLNVVVSKPSGLTETDRGFRSVNVYPVPADQQISVRFKTVIESNIEVAVMNTLGQTLMSQMSHLQKGDQQIELNTGPLSEGVYFILLRDIQNNTQWVSKLEIAR